MTRGTFNCTSNIKYDQDGEHVSVFKPNSITEFQGPTGKDGVQAVLGELDWCEKDTFTEWFDDYLTNGDSNNDVKSCVLSLAKVCMGNGKNVKEKDDELYFLTDMHLVIFIMEEKLEESRKFSLMYVNLYSEEIKVFSFSHADVNGNFGTQEVRLHSTQLFIVFKSQVNIFHVDFLGPVVLSKWSSQSVVSRLFTCQNVIVMINNHQHPESFLCLTFISGHVFETYVKKTILSTNDTGMFEIPLVLNVKGRLMWIAQSENLLQCLSIHNDTLKVLKTFDFNVASKYHKIQVKKLTFWNNCLLFAPMLCVNNENNDCSVAISYEIVVIDMVNLLVLYVLASDCELNLYTDSFDINLLSHGKVAHVKITRKLEGNKNYVMAEHVYHLQSKNLKELSRSVLLNHFPADSLKDFHIPCNLRDYLIWK